MMYVDDNLCTGCGLCFEACTQGAISIIDDRRAVVDADLCNGCGNCVAVCLTQAIAPIEVMDVVPSALVAQTALASRDLEPEAPPYLPAPGREAVSRASSPATMPARLPALETLQRLVSGFIGLTTLIRSREVTSPKRNCGGQVQGRGAQRQRGVGAGRGMGRGGRGRGHHGNRCRAGD